MIRPATEHDLPRVIEIQNASPEGSQWDAQSYLAFDCLVYENAAGSTDGFLVGGFLAARRIAPGEHELLNLAVDPLKRRQGIARALLEDALRRWPGVWFLEVRESNAAAIGLYQTLGFQAVGKRERYYTGPVEAGIVMKFVS